MHPAQTRLAGADWITTPIAASADGPRPAFEFRSSVSLDASPAEATLAVTAHGVYEAFVNGVRVGTDELTPGATSYRRTLYVQEYDIAGMLAPGRNEVRFVVSDGWFRGRCGARRLRDNFGTDIGVIARLDVDGIPILATGDAWETAAGAIIAADLMDGQTTDFRRLGREEWVSAVASTDSLTADRTRLGFSPAPPVRRMERFAPVSVTVRNDGRQIVDFGQNISGWVALTRLGPEGNTVTLTHGEALSADGDLTQANLDAPTGPMTPPLPVGQRDSVISRGVDGDVFEPRHTTHGFQFVAVDGLEEALTPEDITAWQVRSQLRPRGRFSSSDTRLNGLHRIATTSWHANSCDIPTDCPQRERWGYTGDFQIFARSAAFLDDISGFSRKWLTSLADDQHADGLITNVAPACGDQPSPSQPMSFDGSAGWGDAATIVPWELYRAYGDLTVLSDFYDMMTRWVDWAARAAASGRYFERQVRNAVAPSHETYLWDTGWHWGEWLEPGVEFDFTADKAIIATAYLAHSAGIVADAAALLGRVEDVERFGALAARAREAWQIEFVTADGRLRTPSQANYARGLAFDLFPEPLRPAAAAHLAEDVRRNGERLSTGFLSTGMLLPVLADHGYTDLAYSVLFQSGEPGWLVMLDRGASTVWENWSGVSADGAITESLNHYSKGAVVSFLHEYTAGLRPLRPGYHHIEVCPVVTDRLRHASAELDTPAGTISSAWHWSGSDVIVEVVVPETVSAVIVLPDGARHEVGGGAHTFRSGAPTPAVHPLAPSPAPDHDQRLDLSPFTVGRLLEDPRCEALIDEVAPEFSAGPMALGMRQVPISGVLAMAPALLGAERAGTLQTRLAPLVRDLITVSAHRSVLPIDGASAARRRPRPGCRRSPARPRRRRRAVTRVRRLQR